MQRSTQLVMAVTIVLVAQSHAGANNPEEERPRRERRVKSACSTEVVLLKAAGSPLWWAGRSYEGGGTMSALLVRGRVYLVDLADGIGARYIRAGLGGEPLSQNIAHLRGVFITHMNNDHLSGLPTLLSQGSSQQIPPEGRIKIVGPFPNGVGRDGIAGVFEKLVDALSYDFQGDPLLTYEPVEIALPEEIASVANVVDRSPEMAPLKVFEDGFVTVWAVLVNHDFPAFAYRFETPDGVITFSGDTSAQTNGNLIRLAQGSDILVHEAYDVESYLEPLFGEPPYPPNAEVIRERFENGNTRSDEVGEVAQQAGVGTLILNHLIPAPLSKELRYKYYRDAKEDFSGAIRVGRDLLRQCL